MSDVKNIDQEEEKDKGGRPLKFQSVKELKQKIEEYFGDCDAHVATRQFFKQKIDGTHYLAEEEYITDRQPYTVNGMARALGTTRDTLLDYERGKYDDRDDSDEEGERFSDAIKNAKARINEDIERRLLAGEIPAAAGIFWLKNNDGWKDRSEVDHTTKGKEMKALVEFVGDAKPADGQD
ncbi:terminase small subunit [Streptomyces sp. NPDC056401]|uniref:terminase small subunit n=1 Tax=Streptomyces sp. NPDC056401 TaxID=3345809 RepID=UPI0035E16322